MAAIAVCSISSHAQVSFGAQIGANIGMGHASDENATLAALSVANDPKVGFLIGVLGEVDFGQLGFRPELNYIQKGSKYGFGSGSSKITLNYIQVPLNVVYNLELGKSGKLFFGLGPEVAFGISGNSKNSSGKTKVKFDGKETDSSGGDNYKHLKRTDFGVTVLAGFQLEMGAFAKIGYTLGLTDIDPDKNNSDPYFRSSYKNRGLSICVGYMLGGKKKKK